MCDRILAIPFSDSKISTNSKIPKIPNTDSIISDSKISGDSKDFGDSIVKITNAKRARHGAPPLRWDSKLADVALSHAKNCVFDHSRYSYGENLALASVGEDAAKIADRFYSNEVCAYDYANPGFSASTGHFTQVVWKDTLKIGCALVTTQDFCPKGIPYSKNRSASAMLVCEYDPPGNYRGRFPSQVLPPNPPMDCKK